MAFVRATTSLLLVALAINVAAVAGEVSIRGGTAIKDRTVYQQIEKLKSEGYDISRLDDHTQLKVFLYTWMAMERGEGG